jgi:hypothetical protein
MAALPVLSPEAASAPRGGSPMALAVGLVTLVTGIALLLVSVLQPVPRLDAIAVPRTAVNRAAGVRIDAGQGVPEGSEDLRLFATMTRPDTSNRSAPATNDRGGVDQLGPGMVRADLKRTARHPRPCTGANGDSSHHATLPLCFDLHESFAEMAAAAYRRS